MELVVIALVALAAAGLTLFSGFGLGTILMPVFALFFPVPVAIAATAVVHLANNLFKLGLMARQADWHVVFRFGLPAALAAIGGAALLGWIDAAPVLARWSWGTRQFDVTLVKSVIGALVVTFALLEMWPRFQALALPPKWMPFGGLLSSFFGGLSGNQGALRSAFLIKAGLGKEAFVATGGCRCGDRRFRPRPRLWQRHARRPVRFCARPRDPRSGCHIVRILWFLAWPEAARQGYSALSPDIRRHRHAGDWNRTHIRRGLSAVDRSMTHEPAIRLSAY